MKVRTIFFISAICILLIGCGNDKKQSDKKNNSKKKEVNSIKESKSKIDGTIKTIIGSGILVRGSNDLKLRSGLKITSGDILKTNVDSEIEIDFGKKRIIKLGESSELMIENNAIKDFTVSMKEGKMMSILKDLTKGETYHVKGTTAVVGARGTKFLTVVKENGAFFVCVCDGEVEIQPLKNLKQKKVYKKHDTIEIAKNSELPEKPGHNEDHNHVLH